MASAPLAAPCSPTGKPRLIQINKISMDAEFSPHMLYTRECSTKPGHIGALGTLLGSEGVNIGDVQPRAPSRAARPSLW